LGEFLLFAGEGDVYSAEEVSRYRYRCTSN